MPLAARLNAVGRLELEDRPPLAPGAGELVLAVDACGVCGTDLALASGDYEVPLPLVPGHEIVGTVSEVGPSVAPSLVGARVTAEINNTCIARAGTTPCAACRAGAASHCLTRTVTGIISHDGGYAEQVLLPAAVVHALPDDLDAITATLVEPLAAALQTFVMSPISADELIVVVGPGRLGVLVVFVAARLGARVVAVSRSPARRRRALRFGADRALAPEHARSAVLDMTDGLGAPLVVDSTGQAEGVELAMGLCRPRGTIACKTTCGLPSRGLPMTRLVVDELRLQGSRCGPFDRAIPLVTAHQRLLRGLVSDVLPVTRVGDAIELARRVDKVVLTMR